MKQSKSQNVMAHIERGDFAPDIKIEFLAPCESLEFQE